MSKTQYFRKAFCVWSTMISILPESLVEALGLSNGSCIGNCVNRAVGGIDPLTIALLFVTCLVTWHSTTFFWNALQVLATALKGREEAHEYFHHGDQIEDSLEERSPPRAIFQHEDSPTITRYQLQQKEQLNPPIMMLQAKHRSKSKVDCRVHVQHHWARHSTSVTSLPCSSRTYSQDTSYSWCPNRDYLPARSHFVYNNPPDAVMMPNWIRCSAEFPREEASTSRHEALTSHHEAYPSRHEALTSHHEAYPSGHVALTSRHEAHPSRHEALTSRHEPSTSRHEAYPIRQESSTSHHEAYPSHHEAYPIRQESSTSHHEAYPSRHEAYPSRQESSTSHQEASSSRHEASSSRHEAYPNRHEAYPSRHEAYPSRQESSTSLLEAYPSRQEAYPSRQEASTSRHEAYPSLHEAYPSRQEAYPSRHEAYPSLHVSTLRLVRVPTPQEPPIVSKPQPTRSEVTQTKNSDMEQALNKCQIVRSTRSGAVYGIYY